jgi:hypothetical protein
LVRLSLRSDLAKTKVGVTGAENKETLAREAATAIKIHATRAPRILTTDPLAMIGITGEENPTDVRRMMSR